MVGLLIFIILCIFFFFVAGLCCGKKFWPASIAFFSVGLPFLLFVVLLASPQTLGSAKTTVEQGMGEYKVLAYAPKGKYLYIMIDGDYNVFTIALPKKAVHIKESSRKELAISQTGSFKKASLYWPTDSKEVKVSQENGCDTLTYSPKNPPKTIKLKLNHELETLSLMTPKNIAVFRLDMNEPKIKKKSPTI